MSSTDMKRARTHTDAAPDALLDYRALAAYLGIGVRTAKRLASDGELPPPDLRLRRIVRWRRSTIDRWIDRNRKAAGRR